MIKLVLVRHGQSVWNLEINLLVGQMLNFLNKE